MLKAFLFFMMGSFCVIAAELNLEELFQKENLSTQEALSLIIHFQKEKNQDFFLIDVRTKEEFFEAHIRGSINIPLDQESFTAMLDNPVYNRNAYYLLYCYSGSRSRLFLELLKNCEFKRVAHIKAGFNEQTAARFELEPKPKKKSEPKSASKSEK